MRQIIKRQQQEKELVTGSDFVMRDVTGKIDTYLRQDIIKVVTGVRRCGKSIFCFMVLKGTKFGYVNFDEKELVGLENYDEILRYVLEFYGDVDYLFLDEIQNLENWELWVNSLHRRGYNLLITGSNAKLLSRELVTHLTGRHIAIGLFPFSLREYLDVAGFHIRDEYTEQERGIILNHMKKYIEMGGFPEVVVKGYDYTYLQTLFDFSSGPVLVQTEGADKIAEEDVCCGYRNGKRACVHFFRKHGEIDGEYCCSGTFKTKVCLQFAS